MISASVSTLGGLLFGYDNIVISGAIGYLSQLFHLDAVGIGWAAGCALIEERFHQFANGRDAGGDAINDRGLRNAEELSGNSMTALSEADVPDIEYDRDEKKFLLRKNLLDPPYHTRLWKIELA